VHETSTPTTFPDLRVLIIEHEPSADPALVGERLVLAKVRLTVAGPHLADPIPATLDGFDALIVLGGTPGPLEDDKAPWLPQVRSLIAEALDRNLPALGVCLGAQMLAAVAGSEVAPIDAGPEIGLIELEMTDAGRNDPILGMLADTGPVRAIQWHWLEAKSLPAGSTPLFTSQACSNQAFRVGETAWGLQFHLEALTKAARMWSDESQIELDELGINAETDIIAVVNAAEPELRDTWSGVIDRWIAFAASRTRETASA
jgi:GMP synthase-like glutamine amidotransferase